VDICKTGPSSNVLPGSVFRGLVNLFIHNNCIKFLFTGIHSVIINDQTVSQFFLLVIY
jgi:hypothetical protein